MPIKHFKVSEKIWNDKRISPECKEIYCYLYGIGFDRTAFHFNIGDIQPLIPITNVGFRKNINKLQSLKLLSYNEYKRGLYEIRFY